MGIKSVVVSNITNDSILLTWQTTVAASTEADIGIVDAAGNWTPGRVNSGAADATSHSYTITGLTAGSSYRVAAQSFDSTNTFAYLPVDDGSSPVNFNTLAATVVGPPPTLTPPSADGVVVSWTTTSPGMGTVYYAPDGGTQMSQVDDSGVSSTSHKVTLNDLVSSTHYNCHYETDLDGSNINVVSAPFDFTTTQSVSLDPPGHVAMTATPARVEVGDSSTVCVQVLKQDGSPQSGIPVAFSLGMGHAGVTPVAASGLTDATGLCKAQFTVTDIPPDRLKGRRFVVALVGDTSIKQKRRRVMLVGMK
jgi:hypothetical protein